MLHFTSDQNSHLTLPIKLNGSLMSKSSKHNYYARNWSNNKTYKRDHFVINYLLSSLTPLIVKLYFINL